MERKQKKPGMRFSTESEPVYADEYARLKNASDILSPSGQITIYSNIYDKRGCEVALFKLTGDKRGLVLDGNSSILALIPQIQSELQELDHKFKRYCNKKVAEGYEEPTEMPKSMHDEQMKLFARLDILLLEQDALEKRLQEFESKVEAVQNANMLKHGPVASCRFYGGDLVEIDYQSVSRIGGIPVIVEPASPYKGLRVSDYRSHIVEPYCEERNKRLKELAKQRAEELKTRGFSNIPLSLSRKAINKNDLPKWPKGCINYLEENETVTK